MIVKLPIGVDDFRELREGGYWYADKSDLITGLVSPEPKTTVLSRPRRFGKSLAMSMLRCWFEPTGEDRVPLFGDLEVWQAGEEVRATFGRHPVILLSFKDVKARRWQECLDDLGIQVAEEVRRHAYLREALDEGDRCHFDALLGGDPPDKTLKHSLRYLSRWLQAHHGQPVVILIDEYDTPIHAGFTHDYYDEVVSFLRDFLSAGFKGNPALFRGCLTGILHVAKEGLFSGLNNTVTYGVTEPRFARHFGFTEPEVVGLFTKLGAPQHLPEVRRWYNGYLFGDDQCIYNPWSVLRYASDLPRYPRPYWKNTSGDDVLRALIMDRAALAAADVEELLAGGSIWKVITDHVVLRDAYRQPEAAWELLLHSGYLKAVEQRVAPNLRIERRLMLPNLEIRIAFEDAVRQWTQIALGGGEGIEELLSAMLTGDERRFARALSVFTRDALSFMDTSRRQTEAIFQALLLGMLVLLAPRYHVRSNREAGYGRADMLVSLKEPGGVGVVLELKVVDKELGDEPEQILDEALAQITSRDYAAELLAEGCREVICYGAAVQGKRVWVRRGEDRSGL